MMPNTTTEHETGAQAPAKTTTGPKLAAKDGVRVVTADDIVEKVDALEAARAKAREVAKRGNEEIEACREDFKATIETSRSSKSQAVKDIVEDYDVWQTRKDSAREENAEARKAVKEARAAFEKIVAEARQPSLPFVE